MTQRYHEKPHTRLDFNSHAHVERDWGMEKELETITISTHTLTWSVTMGVAIGSEIGFISTHTLTWSVTQI